MYLFTLEAHGVCFFYDMNIIDLKCFPSDVTAADLLAAAITADLFIHLLFLVEEGNRMSEIFFILLALLEST